MLCKKESVKRHFGSCCSFLGLSPLLLLLPSPPLGVCVWSPFFFPLSICGKRTTTRIGRKKSKAAPDDFSVGGDGEGNKRGRPPVHSPPFAAHPSLRTKQNRAADQFVFGIGIIIHRYRVGSRSSFGLALIKIPDRRTDRVARMQSS